MRIKMLKTIKVLGTYPEITLFKGRTYKNASAACNQPNWKEKNLIFVEKNGFGVLLERGEYEVVS